MCKRTEYMESLTLSRSIKKYADKYGLKKLDILISNTINYNDGSSMKKNNVKI